MTETWNAELKKISQPFIQTTLLNGANEALKQVDSAFRMSPNSGRITSAMLERTGKIVSLNTTTINGLRKGISELIETGKAGRSEIKGLINNTLGSAASKVRAENISRTETIWNFNRGALEGYKESSVVAGKEWLTGEDDRLCEYCAAMDGRVADLNASYFAKGSAVMGKDGGVFIADYEDIQHPPLHPQCRCSIIPVIEGID